MRQLVTLILELLPRALKEIREQQKENRVISNRGDTKGKIERKRKRQLLGKMGKFGPQ